MMAWSNGQPEPTSWLYSTSVAEPHLAGAGAVGLRAYLAGAATNAPVTATFADFLAIGAGS